jgi:hypothetical protein
MGNILDNWRFGSLARFCVGIIKPLEKAYYMGSENVVSAYPLMHWILSFRFTIGIQVIDDISS